MSFQVVELNTLLNENKNAYYVREILLSLTLSNAFENGKEL